MSNLHIGDTAPDFTAQTTQGEINLYEYLGDSWGVLFSHPADFTPVCTTELGRVAKLADKFSSRDTKVIALSVDGIEDHEKWADDIEETQGARPDYPIIGDVGGKIADLYGMIPPAAENTQTVRSVFVIGPDKKIKLTLTYPASTGRNFDEILRVIDSLQITAKHRLATPADWQQGDDLVITPAVSNEEAEQLFPGFTTHKPYLRTTPAPQG